MQLMNDDDIHIRRNQFIHRLSSMALLADLE